MARRLCRRPAFFGKIRESHSRVYTAYVARQRHVARAAALTVTARGTGSLSLQTVGKISRPRNHKCATAKKGFFLPTCTSPEDRQHPQKNSTATLRERDLTQLHCYMCGVCGVVSRIAPKREQAHDKHLEFGRAGGTRGGN